MANPPAWVSGLSANPPRRTSFLHFGLMALAGLVVTSFILYTLMTPPYDDAFYQQAHSLAQSATPTPEMPTTTEAPAPIETPTFGVGQPLSSNKLHWDYDAYNQEKLGLRPQQTFRTTDVKSPLFQVNTWKPRATEGSPFFFLTPSATGQMSGVQIFSRKDLSLVYAQHRWHATNNLRVQQYNGADYLTYWAGEPASGHGQGEGIMLDSNYNLAHNISVNTFNSRADSHEFQLTHDGGALLTVYETVRNYDLTSINGPVDGVLQDSCFEEVDIATGKTRFSWRASDWFNITECMVPYNDVEDYGHPTRGDGWDYFHINSLEKTKDGNYLVSGRRLNMVTLINGKTGEPIWQVGGKGNQYKDLSDGWATNFGYQHHVRFDDDNQSELVMFDNSHLANTQPTPGCQDRCSRGLHIRLNHQAKTAERVRSFWHPLSVQARAEGSAHRQPNGNLLVGWGKTPGFTEYAPDGEVLLDVQTGPWRDAEHGERHVYRIYSMDWKAYPPWDPEIVLHDGSVYVSYNGATELAYWAMFSGNSTTVLEPQYIVYRGGFETQMPLPSDAPFVRVAALDAQGNLLGSTDAVNTFTGHRLKAAEALTLDFSVDMARPH